MFTKNQIKSLTNGAYSEFSKKHKVSCRFDFVNLNEFWKLAKKNRLIQQEIRLKIPLKVGALVLHGEKEVICLNEDIINQITNDPNFVKAIVIHELYHVLLRNMIKIGSFNEEMHSENSADSSLKREFPKYAKYMT